MNARCPIWAVSCLMQRGNRFVRYARVTSRRGQALRFFKFGVRFRASSRRFIGANIVLPFGWTRPTPDLRETKKNPAEASAIVDPGTEYDVTEMTACPWLGSPSVRPLAGDFSSPANIWHAEIT